MYALIFGRLVGKKLQNIAVLFRFTMKLQRIIPHQPHINSRSFLIVISALVGIASAFAAILIKNLVHLFQKLPVSLYSHGYTLSFLFFPVIGIVVTTVITIVFFRGKLDKGFSSLLYAVSMKFSALKKNKILSNIITSGVTVGFGGSAGLEAPVVITGAALGSNIARAFNFGYKERRILLACAAASGITTVFNSPVAGIFFALEVILGEITIPVFSPLLTAVISSFVLSKLLYKEHLSLMTTNDWQFISVPFFILLGIICGFISLYMIHANLKVQQALRKLSTGWSTIIGSSVLGFLIFTFPVLFGEGYHTINRLFHQDFYILLQSGIFQLSNNPVYLIIITIIIILLKIVATSLTIGSGGNGGYIASSLFTGALTGFTFAFSVNLTGISYLSVPDFIIASMAGLLSGLIHAPLTSIFLLTELAGGYSLFIPVVIVSVLSFLISWHFEPYSIYEKNLLFDKVNRNDYYSDVLSINELIERNFIPLESTASFKSMLNILKSSNYSIYPVNDQENNFIGIIDNEVIDMINKHPDMYTNMKTIDFTDTTVIPVQKMETMDAVMKKFQTTRHWKLPVVEGTNCIGFISRTEVQSVYRRLLKRSSLLI